MPSNIDVLVEMGFPKNRAEKALAKTNYKGVQEAMEWLFNHADDADLDDPFEAPKGNLLTDSPAAAGSEGGESVSEAATANAQPEQAQSLKCEECGKLLRTSDEVQVHAAKTGHSNFTESTEEIKPLTAEEKERQMTLLQEKLKRKRQEREEKDKMEAKEKEKIRRAQGKDLSMAKFEQEQKEMKILADAKRREKAEERAAKQRALDDIRRDKEARAAARAAAKGEAAPTPAAPVAAPTPAPVVKRDYTECRLQIRLPDGQPLTHTFKANEPLAAVRVFVMTSNPSLPDNFTFMTTVPRKVFSDEDMESPLASLGLVPSAVIMVHKR